MVKKINSEYKIKSNDSFTVTMGTSNKKNPEVIYSILSAYITPENEIFNENIFDDLTKRIKKDLKLSISKNNICNSDIIVVSDVASNRMVVGKQSYFDMQIYFKPQKTNIIYKNNNFKNISDVLYNTYVKNIVTNIEDVLKHNGFVTSNKKNKCNNKTT